MSTLMRLRDWVTLESASAHLSAIFVEPVAPADLLRMCIGGRLTLSLHLVNETYVRRMKVVPLAEAVTATVDLGDGSRELKVPLGARLPSKEQVLEDAGELSVTRGVWDIVTIGAALVELERHYQALVSGPQVDVQELRGAFIHRNSEYWQLVDPPLGHATRAQLAAIADRPKTFLAGSFPPDAALVVRTAELERLIKSSAIADGGIRQRHFGHRERTTLLNIIGTMVDLLVAEEDGARKRTIFRSDAQLIAFMTELYPDVIGIKKSTLEGKFAEGRMSLRGSWTPR